MGDRAKPYTEVGWGPAHVETVWRLGDVAFGDAPERSVTSVHCLVARVTIWRCDPLPDEDKNTSEYELGSSTREKQKQKQKAQN